MNIDLHLHTTAFSPCSAMSPDDLMLSARDSGLDGVCITEHNRIWPAPDAEALSRKHGLAVFRGVEVTTTGGDVLVFGLHEEPGSQIWTPEELRTRVDAVGGVAIAAHPFRGFLLFGFGQLRMNLEDALDNPTFSQVHGLEVCNCMVTAEENALAQEAAEAMGLLMMGGSDAHRAQDVGTCVTRFQDRIRDEQELVRALLAGRFAVERVK
jgi:predicted metal-dependent phosphoesterase TrpH